MDWQQICSLAIVALTAVLLVRSEVKKRRRARLTGCSGDCGCTPASSKPGIHRFVTRLQDKHF